MPALRLQGDHHFVVVGVIIPARVIAFADPSIKKQRVIVVDVPSLKSEHGRYSELWNAELFCASPSGAAVARFRKHQAHQASGDRELGATGRPGAIWNHTSGTKHESDCRKR
jgi:hypothetical protein